MPSEWILGIGELNDYVQHLLQSDAMLRSIRIRGEIGTFKRQLDGTWYFTLKDEDASIDCVMWRQHTARMSLRPAAGMRVILAGSVSLYARTGRYQFYATAMRPDGQGTLYQQFAALKEKLEAEGLFDPRRKRPLPARPKKIAVVTAQRGAVLQDIRRVSARRDPGVPLVLVPSSVQGTGAAAELTEALKRAGRIPGVDVIIIGRGGGSMEDLWCFNDEGLARAIAASPVPVISAVGHETDFTIADFAADVRASTPSNAAELAVPDRQETVEALRLVRRILTRGAEKAVERERLCLMRTGHALAAASPERRLREQAQALKLNRLRLDRAVDDALLARRTLPSQRQESLNRAADALLEKRGRALERLRLRLDGVSPTRPLERGYALVSHGGALLPSAAEARRYDEMTIRFRDGSVTVTRREE